MDKVLFSAFLANSLVQIVFHLINALFALLVMDLMSKDYVNFALKDVWVVIFKSDALSAQLDMRSPFLIPAKQPYYAKLARLTVPNAFQLSILRPIQAMLSAHNAFWDFNFYKVVSAINVAQIHRH